MSWELQINYKISILNYYISFNNRLKNYSDKIKKLLLLLIFFLLLKNYS